MCSETFIRQIKSKWAVKRGRLRKAYTQEGSKETGCRQQRQRKCAVEADRLRKVVKEKVSSEDRKLIQKKCAVKRYKRLIQRKCAVKRGRLWKVVTEEVISEKRQPTECSHRGSYQ
ncbi:hypothetical protein CDAR_499361 [Caerostris darwini]|uniref:Uncharacterized protein n=1 Tax=Caerostris darwini TaxID=1538125 RepID=A0AAV4P018_9ARAC|nr:hypothetical protein CDAR_499361 [Caerostris darwini]